MSRFCRQQRFLVHELFHVFINLGELKVCWLRRPEPFATVSVGYLAETFGVSKHRCQKYRIVHFFFPSTPGRLRAFLRSSLSLEWRVPVFSVSNSL